MAPNEPRRRSSSRDPQIVREEVLRPSHYLGYDRDEMGRYFLGREAFELAESQFRRAVWLNPYEPAFKTHWALVLVLLDRRDDARRLLEEVLNDDPNNRFGAELWNRYWPDEPTPGRSHGGEPGPRQTGP